MGRLQVIDDLTRIDHSHLDADDACIYYGEYTSYEGYQYSPTNDLINNLKKEMKYRDRPNVWQYKAGAIRRCANIFRSLLKLDALGGTTLVPIPPSKSRDDAEYDDRMIQV